MIRRLPRIPVLRTLSLLGLVTVLVLWCRSPRHADVLTFYTPSGHLAGLASDRTGLLLGATDIPFDNEMALAAQTMSVLPEDFAPVHDLLFDSMNQKWHFLGFRTAAGTLGPWNWKFSAMIVPYWALVIPLAVLPIRVLSKAIVRCRRKRRGQCVDCGYDLRHSPGQCPECGRPVRPIVQNGAESPPRLTIKPARALSWFALGLLLAATCASLDHGRRAALTAATTPPECALLERRISRVDLQNINVSEALRAIGQSAQTPVQVSGTLVDSAKGEACPMIVLRDVPLDAALHVVCEQWHSPGPAPLQLWASRGTVNVAPPPSSPLVVRCYALGQFLQEMQAELNWEALDQQQHLVGLGSPHGAGSFYRPPSRPSIPPKAATVLSDLICDTIRPEDWWTNGGRLGGLYFSAGQLWVLETQEGHAAVRSFLAMLQSPASSTEPAPQETHADLYQMIPELKLESTTLERAIQTLREQTKANIVVYWDDLERLGAKRDAPIQLHLWNVSLDQALGILLTLSGIDDSAITDRTVRDGIIIVGSPARLRGAPRVTRIYDVRDLIDEFWRESRLPTQATRPAPTINGTNVWNSELTYVQVAENFSQLIQDAIDPDSWRENGGNIGVIHALGGHLIITQTPTNHRKIVNLLRTLRAGGSKEGADLSGMDQKPPR